MRGHFIRIPLLALLLSFSPLFAVEVRAGWVGFRNDTNLPIIVRETSVVRKTVRPGTSHLLYPGEVAWDCVLKQGRRLITVVDANHKKTILRQEPVSCGSGDCLFSIKSKSAGQVQLVTAPRPAVPGSR